MTDEELHFDVETRSIIDLPDTGAHLYFEHASTALWCAAYSFGKEEPAIWRPGMSCPQRVHDHIVAGGTITAWNAAFERLAFRHILTFIHGWPAPDDRQFRCTMTESLALNMPGQLEKAAPAFGLSIVKDDKGHRLMKQMCRPRSYDGNNKPIWWDDEEKRERLEVYCLQDVRTEVAVGERVMRLRASEQELYFMDMKINDRGVYIDADLCQAAQKIVDISIDRLNEELTRITGNEVGALTNVAQLTRWLNSMGVECTSLDRESIEDLLILDNLPDDCRRALEIRQEGSKTSTAKISAMLQRRQKDGRMRGNLQFYGASATGRWAARGAQLQNLTRPKILGSKKAKPTPLDEQIETAISTIHQGSAVWIELIYGAPLTLVSDCIRSMICAPAGKRLMASDFSNIEGRMVAWLAGQEDKLDAFRAYDEGTGPDIYLVAAAGIYGVSIEDAEPHRQIGKVGELSLGFQGGPRAFAKMSKNYGVRIGQLFGPIWEMAAAEFKEQAIDGWPEHGKRSGMAREAWLASEVIKLAWRAKNYRIAAFWGELEEAAITAVANPGTITQAGYIKYRKVGSFLFCLLPSGRALSYPYARLEEKKTPWGEMRHQIVYKAIDQYTRKWGDKAFYGGLGVENVTQAASRDVMAEAMLRVDKAGYDVVLSVHDETVSEIFENFGSLEEYNILMAQQPLWCPGLPISVAGWCGKRYRKG